MPLSYPDSTMSGGWCGAVDSQMLIVGGVTSPRSESTAEVIQLVESWHLAAAGAMRLLLVSSPPAAWSLATPGCCIRRARSMTITTATLAACSLRRDDHLKVFDSKSIGLSPRRFVGDDEGTSFINFLRV